MLIPDELKEKIQALLDSFISDPTPCVANFDDPIDIRRLAADLNLLPLLFDMGGCYCIRPNGEILSFTWDDPKNLRIEEDVRIRNIALFQGSKKYQELKSLIPSKSQQDIECPHCKGTGIEPMSVELKLDNIMCYCGGLGWIPKENDVVP